MYFDITYLIMVLPCVILSLWASANVKGTYRKYASQLSRRGITAEQAARQVLNANGLYNVQIGRISGELTDHFDPKDNIIRLSDSVYGSTSTAAIGVACHEAGHAVQHAVGYFPIQIRSAIIPVTNIGSKLAMPLILIGLIINSASFDWLIDLGLLCFSLSTLFQLVTLPTEFNASSRALQAISQGNLLTEEELRGARKTLRAAALTYVAALAVSLMQLLRLILLYGGRGRRRR